MDHKSAIAAAVNSPRFRMFVSKIMRMVFSPFLCDIYRIRHETVENN